MNLRWSVLGNSRRNWNVLAKLTVNRNERTRGSYFHSTILYFFLSMKPKIAQCYCKNNKIYWFFSKIEILLIWWPLGANKATCKSISCLYWRIMGSLWILVHKAALLIVVEMSSKSPLKCRCYSIRSAIALKGFGFYRFSFCNVSVKTGDPLSTLNKCHIFTENSQLFQCVIFKTFVWLSKLHCMPC